MTDYKDILLKLHNNLNLLREREAKYGGNPPLELVNQISDHEQAIALTEQVIAGELTETEWGEALKPLLVSIDSRSGEAAVSNVSQIASGSYIAQASHGGVATVNVTHVDTVGGDFVGRDKVIIGGDAVFYLGGRKVTLPLYLQLVLAGVVVGVLFLVIWQMVKIWTERPASRMPDSTFNIAVAEFTPNFAGADKEGTTLADGIALYLDGERDTLRTTLNQSITIWGHEPTVDKVDPPAEDVAERRAAAINAHILVYGSLTAQPDGAWKLEPKFHLYYKNFEIPDELLGTHRLGKPIPGLASKINEDLKTRIKDFTLFLTGIIHFSQRDFDEYQKAEKIFETLASDENSNLGREVVYLFLGTSYLKQASCYEQVNEKASCFKEDNPEKRGELLLKAQETFSKAIALNPQYGRAYIGLGAAYFEQAQPLDPARQCEWDWDTLQSAQAAYQQAGEAKEKPEGAALDLRTKLGLGRIFFWQGVCSNDETRWTKFSNATINYEAALREYKNMGEPIELTYDAMMAYTDLGHIALSYYFFDKPLLNNKPPLIAAITSYSHTIQLADEFITRNSNPLKVMPIKAKIEEVKNHKWSTLPFLIAAFCVNDQQDLARYYLNQQSEIDRADLQKIIINKFYTVESLQECIYEK